MIKFIIRKLGLKGSWKWAKRQMIKGNMVRCKRWPENFKLSIDENTLLRCNFQNECVGVIWIPSKHFLLYEDFTDYIIFKW